MKTLNYREFYIRSLPHYQPEDAIFAITFRLAFDLPKQVIQKLDLKKKEFELNIENYKGIEAEVYRNEFKKQCFDYYDDFIGKYSNKFCWLSNKEIADMISDSLHFFDAVKYDLISFCIMPNHVHLVIKPLKKVEGFYSLAEIIHSIKGYTAGKANQILNRKGIFWNHYYYDHAIRDHEDFVNQVNYVLNNPVKAGLVDDWKEWEFVYLK